MSKFTIKKRNRKQIKRHSKTYKRSKTNKRNKTRKLIKKGGDIMYSSTLDAEDMWREQMPRKDLICIVNKGKKVCLAFGDVSDQVKSFFYGFTRFNYAKEVIKRIGKPSANGFIFEIENETRGYTSYSVLKSAQEPESDNLMYEYHVGLYMNKLNKLYPCFVETYGLFKYKNETQWNKFKDVPEEKNKIINLHALQSALVPQPLDYTVGCKESKHLAILIQHLPKPITLDELSDDTDFIKNELMGALFQLYVPLAQVMNNFTHYDLHLENILLYEPVKGKYIEYHYHYMPTTFESSIHLTGTARSTKTAHMASMKPEVFSFKSSYLLKIIDYGRSYFNNTENQVDSKQIYQEICDTKECDYQTSNGTITCGANFGLGWLEDNSADQERTFYISSQFKNISHDLLPLDRLYTKYEKKMKEIETTSKGTNKANSVIFTQEIDELIGKVDYMDDFGTEENLKVGYPAKIFNVQDAAIFIMNCIEKPHFITHNNAVNRTKDKLGDLHIYMDGSSRPMEFIPNEINL